MMGCTLTRRPYQEHHVRRWRDTRSSPAPVTFSTNIAEKVFKRLGYEVKRGDVEAIVNCKPGVIEAVLMQLQQKVRARQGRVQTQLPIRLYRRAPDFVQSPLQLP